MLSKKIRKTHSNSFKFQVVLKYLKGQVTVSELSQEFKISSSCINKWVKQFKEGGKEIFSSNNNIELSNKSLEISKLHEKIVEVIMERDFLKKVLGE